MQKLYTDNAPKMVKMKTPLFNRARKEGIYLTTIELNLPDENYGENIAGKAQLGASKIIVRKRVTLRLW